VEVGDGERILRGDRTGGEEDWVEVDGEGLGNKVDVGGGVCGYSGE